MKKSFLIKLILLLFLIPGCETVSKKSDAIIKKENKKLSEFIGQPVSELKIVMGKPDKIIIDEKGVRFLVYISTKYKISCERRFEINQYEMVVGFSSKGCF